MSGRGLALKSKVLIRASYKILEQIQPASVRSVCYQLFTRGIINSMKTSETQKVSRLLVFARENEIIAWSWIVDETREPERVSAWGDLSDYGQTIVKSYRKDFWQHQPERIGSGRGGHPHASQRYDQIEIGPYLSRLCESLAASMIGDSRPISLLALANGGTAVSAKAVSLGLEACRVRQWDRKAGCGRHSGEGRPRYDPCQGARAAARCSG